MEPDVLEYMKANSVALLVCPFKNNISWFSINKNNEKETLAEVKKVKPSIKNIKVVGNHTNGEYNLQLQGVTKADEKIYKCVSKIDNNLHEFEISLRISCKYNLNVMS